MEIWIKFCKFVKYHAQDCLRLFNVLPKMQIMVRVSENSPASGQKKCYWKKTHQQKVRAFQWLLLT